MGLGFAFKIKDQKGWLRTAKFGSERFFKFSCFHSTSITSNFILGWSIIPLFLFSKWCRWSDRRAIEKYVIVARSSVIKAQESTSSITGNRMYQLLMNFKHRVLRL